MITSTILILASQSPRRKKILTELGYSFIVQPSHFDERSIPENLPPATYVAEVSLGKGQAILDQAPDTAIILASDLSVVSDGQHIHKPLDLIEAAAVIKNLWGKWHTEYGACVVGSKATSWHVRNDEVHIWIPPLTDGQLQTYLEIADPTDKAGGFDLACYASLVGKNNIIFNGDVSTIIGLNANSAAELLTQCGIPNQVRAEEVEKKLTLEVLGS